MNEAPLARSMREHPLFAALISLNLPAEDYAIFGSGPLYAAGLVEDVSDVDVLVRGAAWTFALTRGTPKVPTSGVGEEIVLGDGSIELFNAWAPGPWDVDALIDTADVVDGLHFVRVEHVVDWKRRMGRPKDLALLARLALDA